MCAWSGTGRMLARVIDGWGAWLNDWVSLSGDWGGSRIVLPALCLCVSAERTQVGYRWGLETVCGNPRLMTPKHGRLTARLRVWQRH